MKYVVALVVSALTVGCGSEEPEQATSNVEEAAAPTCEITSPLDETETENSGGSDWFKVEDSGVASLQLVFEKDDEKKRSLKSRLSSGGPGAEFTFHKDTGLFDSDDPRFRLQLGEAAAGAQATMCLRYEKHECKDTGSCLTIGKSWLPKESECRPEGGGELSNAEEGAKDHTCCVTKTLTAEDSQLDVSLLDAEDDGRVVVEFKLESADAQCLDYQLDLSM